MTGANAYARVSVESAVLSADQTQLTTLLFDGALGALARAKLCIGSGDIAARGHNLSKAMDIIDNGLKRPLQEWPEDPLAQQLTSLYDYIIYRLLQANLHQDIAAVSEAETLLGDIASGWKQSLQTVS
ncbi:flagellar export chaperone FliS [Tatumella citrea]|nr:flagellar export chaperone FliS [Tatumella citrea]